jgi:DNA polymerase III sliding clamp (beta) subunit (PCNA family)
LADDQVAADTAGHGRVAFKISHGIQLLDALTGDCVHVDAGDSAGGPILITDPDDANFTAVQMPCVVTWGHADG